MGVQRVELQEYEQQTAKGAALLDADISLIKNVRVQLEILIGDAEVTVEELFNLEQGSVLPMKQSVGEPVTIRLDGKTVARGELVAVDDNFGVRITEIAKHTG